MTEAERLVFAVAERLGMMASDVAERMTAAELIKWATINEHEQEQEKQKNVERLAMLARAQAS